MRRALPFLLPLLLVAASLRAQEQPAPPPGGKKEEKRGPSVKLSGLLQGRFTAAIDRDEASAVSGSGAAATSPTGFSVPRARIRASGEVVPRIGFVVEGDLANTSALLTDGYARLTFVPYHEIRIGQMKTQFGYENPEGDTRLLVINRTLVSNALGREQNGPNAASGDTRDVGVGVLGKVPVVEGVTLEWAGTLVNGAGSNRTTDDALSPQKDFWGRVGPALKLGASTLRVGASLGRGYDVGAEGTPAQPYRYLFRRVGADVQLDTPWAFAAAEFVRGTDALRAGERIGAGAFLYAYGKTPWNAGPLLRIEGFDPSRSVRGDFRRRFTLGAYYDHLPLDARVVFNYERDHSAARRDDALLVQTQVVF